MFTGIVEDVGKVTSVRKDSLVIASGAIIAGMKHGDSVAVNGVCLTVAGFDASSFSVDIMPETLRRSNLGSLKAGGSVNLERALALGGRLGGHLVQGHVDDTGRVSSVTRDVAAVLIRIDAPSDVMRYVVEKGFIAVDGVSLTVVSRDAVSFLVSVVGYTAEHTALGKWQVGDVVNLEVDIIAKYVEQLAQAHQTGITADFLQKHGFMAA